MRFILRSMFWLSLVFSALPDTANIPALAMQDVVSHATGSLTDLCQQNAQDCMNAMAKLAAIDPDLVPASLVAPAPLPAKAAQKPAKPVAKDKIGTLIDNDLTPAWRGQAVKM